MNINKKFRKRSKCVKPISGMTAWKRPKKNAIIKKVRQQMRRMIIPLVMETVKQSIARLMARSHISKVVIS